MAKCTEDGPTKSSEARHGENANLCYISYSLTPTPTGTSRVTILPILLYYMVLFGVANPIVVVYC
jgi:hypothetical protein